MKRLALTLTALAALTLPVTSAGAWANSGHRMVGVAAMQSLPDDLPAFMHTSAAAMDVGEFSREPDRWKGGGRTHDRDRDTAHFIDLDDDGHVLSAAGPAVTALPELRSEYERLLNEADLDVDDAGYLPYALIDGYQQLIRDFGYWRVLNALEARETDPGRQAWYRRDRERREDLLLRDIGVLSHYVGDGAQPLHLSIHYNGWGDYPNPEGFTTSRQFHNLVDSWPYGRIDVAAVEGAMAAPSDCAIPCPISERVPAYILTSLGQVPALYRLEQSGSLAAGDDASRQFMLNRLAAGASELRDLITAAWRESARARIGWPAIRVNEVEDGTITDAWSSLYGAD